MYGMKSYVQPSLRIANPEDFTDMTQAVKMTGLSRTGIYGMIRDGRLKAHRIGAHLVFWADDIAELARAIKLVRGDDPARGAK